MEPYQLFLIVFAGISVALFLILRKIFGPIIQQHYIKPRRQRYKGKKGNKKGKNQPKKKKKTPVVVAKGPKYCTSSSTTQDSEDEEPLLSPTPTPPPTPAMRAPISSPPVTRTPTGPPETLLPTPPTPLSSVASSDTDPTAPPTLEVLHHTMYSRLHIDPGHTRAHTLATLIQDIIFTSGMHRRIPLREPATTRTRVSRETACIFLLRYGVYIWPPFLQPAPHLISRELHYPRDAMLSDEARAGYEAMGTRAPPPESGMSVAMSELGRRVTGFVEEVLLLSWERRASVDWGVVGLVLDRPGVGEVGAWERVDELPWGLREQLGEI